jgi:alkylhydroperoxidase/carboxymuconolactone decarboxylase family protein YurZ
MKHTNPTQLSDSPTVDLPETPNRLAAKHPQVWAQFQKLGEQTSTAGPLGARERRLVHLALAIGADSQGAVHSHVRRGMAEGLTPQEMEHVALLAITTSGWPRAMRALTWMWDVTGK